MSPPGVNPICAVLLPLGVNPVAVKQCNGYDNSNNKNTNKISDMFPVRNGLKQGDALSPLLFNFALEFTIRRAHVNQEGLKINGRCHILVMLMTLVCWAEVCML
jgi:hypothetical protein